MRKGAILAQSPSGAWLTMSVQCTCASIWQCDCRLCGAPSASRYWYFRAGNSTCSCTPCDRQSAVGANIGLAVYTNHLAGVLPPVLEKGR